MAQQARAQVRAVTQPPILAYKYGVKKMVSAQGDAVVRFYRKAPSGQQVFLYGNHVKALGPSGSSDGTIASTPEKWVYIPPQASKEKILQVNDHLVATIEAKTAFTSDASDGEVILPLTLLGGGVDILTGFDNSRDWDVQQFGDVALLANQEITCAEKTIRQPCVFGNNYTKAFVSVENNA